jgi:hypothetical protein
MILVARTATSQPAAAQNGGHHRVLAPWHLGTSICPSPRVWRFLFILKEPLLVAMRPSRKLKPHQCHQRNGAHHPGR